MYKMFLLLLLSPAVWGQSGGSLLGGAQPALPNALASGFRYWTLLADLEGMHAYMAHTVPYGLPALYRTEAGFGSPLLAGGAGIWVGRQGMTGFQVLELAGGYATRIGPARGGLGFRWQQASRELLGTAHAFLLDASTQMQLGPSLYVGASFQNALQHPAAPAQTAVGIGHQLSEQLLWQAALTMPAHGTPAISANIRYLYAGRLLLTAGYEGSPSRLYWGMGIERPHWAAQVTIGSHFLLGYTSQLCFLWRKPAHKKRKAGNRNP